jgi:excisionase family DNA binding protein
MDLGARGAGVLVTDRLLTTREVAELVGISTETVLRWWRRGELPGYRLASDCLRCRESDVGARRRRWSGGGRSGRRLGSGRCDGPNVPSRIVFGSVGEPEFVLCDAAGDPPGQRWFTVVLEDTPGPEGPL